MSEVKVLSLQQEKEWSEVIDSFPEPRQDIYFTPRFASLEETAQSGRSICFCYSEGGRKGIMTYFLRPIFDTGYFDVETFYGYGGPVTDSHCPEFNDRFEREWLDYCKESSIVAEFQRFHPLLINEGIFQKDIRVIKNRNTVYIDLLQSDPWMDCISSKNRNMIRKAEKKGLRVDRLETLPGIEQFKQIYKSTMDYLNADDYFYFSDQYFERIKSIGDNLFLLGAFLDDRIVAASMFLKWKNYFHYHLSGSLAEYRSLAPTNLIIWEAMKTARSAGCGIMHLGGGRTEDPDDSLFSFKKTFSPKTADFYIGTRVHNHSVYNDLIDQWQKNNPGKKRRLFLQYRYTTG